MTTSREQRRAGRFERPLNNRLANVSTWLEMNDVVGSQSKFQVIVRIGILRHLHPEYVEFVARQIHDGSTACGIAESVGSHTRRCHAPTSNGSDRPERDSWRNWHFAGCDRPANSSSIRVLAAEGVSDFLCLSHTLDQEAEYGDQERDFG